MNDAIKFDFLTPQVSSNKTLKSGAVAGSYSGKNNEGKDSVSNLFMTTLNQLLNKNGIRQNEVSNIELTKKELSSNVDISSDSVKIELSKELNKAKGFEFITKLKQYLMTSGHSDLKDVSMGNDGLEAIKIMLSKAGFPNSKVAELIKTLQSESDTGKVFVSDLMDGLLGLDLENLSAEDFSTDGDVLSIDKKSDKNDKDLENSDLNGSQILDMSSIPFISSIMKSLGVSDDLVNSIIANSEVKGEGLSLNSLVSELQSVQKTSFFTGKSFENNSDVASIKEMFSQLGLPENSKVMKKSVDNDKITLNDLVSALEELKGQQELSKESSTTDLNQIKKSPLAAFESNIIDKKEIKGDDSESDSLLKKIMGDLQINNSASAKAVEENEPTETEMRYRTFKSANHNLLMNLAEAQDNNSVKDMSSNSNDNDNKNIKDILASLGIEVKTKSDDTSEEHKDIKDVLTSLGIEVKTKSDDTSEEHKDIKDVLTSLGIEVKTKSDTKSNKTEITETKTLTDNVKIADAKNLEDAKTINLEDEKKDIKDVLTSLGIEVKTKSDDTSKEHKDIKDVLTSLGIDVKTKSDDTSEEHKDIKDVLTSLGIEVKTKSDDTSEEHKDIKDALTSLGILGKSKVDRDKLDNTLNKGKQVDTTTSNVFPTIQEQNSKTISDMLGIASGSGDSVNSKIVSDIISSISNNEILSSGKKNDQQSRISSRSENDFDSIISRVDKKQSLNISDSNYSSDSGFSGQNDQNSGKSSSLGGTTNRTASSILPSYVTNQVVRSINRAFNNGESEIRLQLRPAELGRIFMTIDTQGDTLKVSVVTENQAAKDILTSNANDLKNTLANSGINIESFDVEMGSDFKQSMANSGQQSQNESNSGKNRGSGSTNSNIATVESEGAAVPNFLNNEDGNLHFVA
ncbi:MAG: flagellar hook-length control protein FliK [Desulfamplus sp.]|nr:flagellar hook-length control protein FliK [Desulfamplus sp.]